MLKRGQLQATWHAMLTGCRLLLQLLGRVCLHGIACRLRSLHGRRPPCLAWIPQLLRHHGLAWVWLLHVHVRLPWCGVALHTCGCSASSQIQNGPNTDYD